MKAIRLYGQRGPDQIVFEDAPQPQPGVGEVLIRVHATSVMWLVNTLRSGRIWPANVEHCQESWTLGQTFLEKLLLIWLLSSMFCK
jgi:NADPH:quinone reductase-like Zn-dependent oxidoreductase